MLTDGEVAKLFPELRPLIDIRNAGWKFLPVGNGPDIPELDAARVWHGGWRDALRIRTATDAMGLRIRLPADNHTRPEIVWEFSGTLADVVGELLVLPMPEARAAPNLIIGSAPGLWTP